MTGKFLKVKCTNDVKGKKCGNEQVIFDKPSSLVKCQKCGGVIAQPTGGRAEIRAKVLEKAKA